ncbi:hypothetical protein PROFFT_A_02470 [Candidatus Profftia tarda]|uniref:Uncharacterized protein n=1 Tax=Candidatus Profftia tarda TaxID=1177216 RepID=A0A8E4GI48_9ENTR|nr:hypothetical protein PROFFT_A_02470 [Candidatus Profftia tarda]
MLSNLYFIRIDASHLVVFCSIVSSAIRIKKYFVRLKIFKSIALGEIVFYAALLSNFSIYYAVIRNIYLF